MDIDALIRLAAALGAVLGLVLLAAWAMRRFGFGGLAAPAAGQPSEGPGRTSAGLRAPLIVRLQLAG